MFVVCFFNTFTGSLDCLFFLLLAAASMTRHPSKKKEKGEDDGEKDNDIGEMNEDGVVDVKDRCRIMDSNLFFTTQINALFMRTTWRGNWKSSKICKTKKINIPDDQRNRGRDKRKEKKREKKAAVSQELTVQGISIPLFVG